mgnify:CR=1 FL=1
MHICVSFLMVKRCWDLSSSPTHTYIHTHIHTHIHFKYVRTHSSRYTPHARPCAMSTRLHKFYLLSHYYQNRVRNSRRQFFSRSSAQSTGDSSADGYSSTTPPGLHLSFRISPLCISILHSPPCPTPNPPFPESFSNGTNLQFTLVDALTNLRR